MVEVNKALFSGSDEFFIRQEWNAAEVSRLPARTLAYVGDAVYELGLRMRHIRSGIDNAGRLHDSLVGLVSSTAQAKVFEVIFAELPENDRELVKTWRNAKMPSRYGSGTKGEYARATALEAWAGYLFLTGQNERLQKLLSLAVCINEKEGQGNNE